MAVLLLELTLKRIYSVTQGYHFAFLAVSLGLLGFRGQRNNSIRLATVAASGPVQALGHIGPALRSYRAGKLLGHQPYPFRRLPAGVRAGDVPTPGAFLSGAGGPILLRRNCPGVVHISGAAEGWGALRRKPGGVRGWGITGAGRPRHLWTCQRGRGCSRPGRPFVGSLHLRCSTEAVFEFRSDWDRFDCRGVVATPGGRLAAVSLQGSTSGAQAGGCRVGRYRVERFFQGGCCQVPRATPGARIELQLHPGPSASDLADCR